MKNRISSLFGIFIVLLFTQCNTLKYANFDEKMMNIGVSTERFKEEIPIIVKKNRIYMKVNIQNKDYTFMVSTTARYSVIDSLLAQKLNAPVLYNVPVNVSDRNKPEKFVKIPELKIGNVTFSDVPCYAYNKQNEENCNCNCGEEPLPVDGYIGVNMLKEIIWQFDYKNQKAILCSHQDSLKFASDKKVLQLNAYDNFYSLPLRVNQNYITDLRINTENSVDFQLSERLVGQNKTISPKHITYYYINEKNKNRTDSFRLRCVNNMEISNKLQIKTALISSDSSKYNQMGVGFLSQFVCTFDFKKSELILSDYKENPKEASFGYYIAYEADKVIVHSLVKNTAPYLAGLKIRDHVVRINNQELENITKVQLEQLEDVYKQDEVKISIKRDGKVLDFTFPKIYLIDLLTGK